MATDREFINEWKKDREEIGKPSLETPHYVDPDQLKRAVSLELDVHGVHCTYADFSGVDFRNTYLTDCILYGSNFTDANLDHASFRASDLDAAIFRNARLYSTSLTYAELVETDFTNADLQDANLQNVDLTRARGIKVIAPVGYHGRIIHAFTRNGKVWVQAGCRCASPAQVRKAIKEEYDSESPDYADYMDAVNLLGKWGTRELARIKALG